MQPLVIKVEDVDSGEAWVYVREESPVLLGRGEGATLTIDRAFVSAVHGTFAYDDARACWTYTDLESAAGTVLGDRRLAPEEIVPLPPSSALRVGTLAFTVLAEAPADPPASDAGSPFAIAAPAAERAAITDTAPLPVRLEAASETRPAPADVPTNLLADVPADLPTNVPADEPAPVTAGGTLLLPGSLPELPPRLRRREPAPRGARPRETPRARAVRIAAVAIGATVASSLVTWLAVRPPPPRPPDITDTARAVEPEPPSPPAPRRTYVAPETTPRRDEPPPPQAASPPRAKRRAPPPAAGPERRGANGSFVLE